MASSLDDVMRPYRFEELGSFQFERVCRELLDLEAGFTSDEWRQLPSGHAAPPTRTISPELQRILDAPPRRPRSDRALVARVLRDL